MPGLLLALVLAAPCHAAQLRPLLADGISEKTGQHTVVVRLENTGARCTFDGYPRVVVLDGAGRAIPFRIGHDGDQMIRSAGPRSVAVARGGSAYVLLNHYRCDRGDVRVAARLRLGGVAVALPARVLTWCGGGDPGSLLTVSPYVPTLSAALRG